jgi:hypothetical protein
MLSRTSGNSSFSKERKIGRSCSMVASCKATDNAGQISKAGEMHSNGMKSRSYRQQYLHYHTGIQNKYNGFVATRD